MSEFAVWHEGMPETQGRWVLAVDGERFLLCGEDQLFYWWQITDCKLVKVATPDQPRLVLPVQQGVQPTIVMPNRAMRRENGRLAGL